MILFEHEGQRYVREDMDGYPGAVMIAEVPRAPDEFESWDTATAAFVIDRDCKADTRAGREHIREMRMLKLAEAAMVLAGVTPAQGMLAEEAAQRGISVQALAKRVMDNAAPMRARELQRIAEKG